MKLKHILLISLGLTAIGAKAQDLNSEITVTTEVVPEERAATRLQLLPVLQLPTVQPGRLAAATMVSTAQLTPGFLPLEPLTFSAMPARSPWRGYASLSYGPLYNLAASAGYRFFNTERFTLHAYMQFDGFKYTSTHQDEWYREHMGKVTLRRNNVAVGARADYRPFKGGQLSTNAMYTYSNYNFPLKENNRLHVNLANLTARWSHALGSVDYNAVAEYYLTGNGGVEDALTENRLHIGGAVTWHAAERSHWGMDLDWERLGLTGGYTKGVLHIEPRYLFTAANFRAKLGVALDLRTGNVGYRYSGMFCPDIRLEWLPTESFTLWGALNGKLNDNSMWNLYEAQPYILPTEVYSYSRVANGDVGINLGPWRGGSVGVFVGYSATDDWLMPAIRTGYWRPVSIDGAHIGASASYSYRQYLTVNARWELAPGAKENFSRGYCYWGDHAGMNFMFDATIRPIRPLSIQLGYHLRTRRAKEVALGDLAHPDGYQPLGTINNVTLGVNYAITPQWSANLRVENLLNHIYYIGPAIPSQGISAMIGASYKF